MNSHKTATLLISTFIVLVACTKNSTPDACTVQNPPETARIAKNHAIDFVLYPAYIPENYTGCGKIWTTDQFLVYSIQFKNGVIRSVNIHDPDKNEIESVSCNFDQDKNLISGSEERCSEFKDYPMWRKNADMGSN